MDRPSSDSHITTTIFGPSMEGRRSYEIGPKPSSRLQKQRSNHGMRAASHGQPFTMSSSSYGTALRNSGGSSGLDDGDRSRKGSIRNAVRKIFGRRSRDVVSQTPPEENAAPARPRHAYHKSEPPAPLPSQPELPEPQLDDDFVHQTLSSSYQTDRPSVSRTASPYALQFPNSVRLKPMDLSSQFASPPQPLRRRKTLPTMLPEEGDTTEYQVPAEQAAANPVPDLGTMCELSTVKSIAERVKKDRRKSRSMDDFQAATARERSVSRKRSEEIRYWRDSIHHPDVPRASIFTTQVVSTDQAAIMRPNNSRGSGKAASRHEQERQTSSMVVPRTSEQDILPSKAHPLKSSPPHNRGAATSYNGENLQRPSSGVGTEMSRDLEDRVAKLEAGLHNFQKSLHKLTADRNRRTIVMGGSSTTRGSSGDMRTPSLLADTLADALEPSGYEYEYGHTIRPSISSQPPLPASVQGRIEDPFGPDLHVARSATNHAGPLTSHAPTPSRSIEPRSETTRSGFAPTPQTTSATMAAVTPGTNGTTQPAQQYTFRSLYQMLADERSARRKLENQLKGLQQDISALHTQLNSSSTTSSGSFGNNLHSGSSAARRRSSYIMLAGSSSRLQDLLRETGEGEDHVEGTTFRQPPPAPAAAAAAAAGLSRFSGSDHGDVFFAHHDFTTTLHHHHYHHHHRHQEEKVKEEYDADDDDDDDDLETPYEAYRTPREKRSKFSLVEKKRKVCDGGDVENRI